MHSCLTPGRSNALVWLMDMPKEAALPSRIMQRHRGSDWTTPASTEQQEIPGLGDLLEMKSRHGERVIITLEQPLLCATACEEARNTTARLMKAAAPVFRAAILRPPTIPSRCCANSTNSEALAKTLIGWWKVVCSKMAKEEEEGLCCGVAGFVGILLYQDPPMLCRTTQLFGHGV